MNTEDSKIIDDFISNLKDHGIDVNRNDVLYIESDDYVRTIYFMYCGIKINISQDIKTGNIRGSECFYHHISISVPTFKDVADYIRLSVKAINDKDMKAYVTLDRKYKAVDTSFQIEDTNPNDIWLWDIDDMPGAVDSENFRKCDKDVSYFLATEFKKPVGYVLNKTMDTGMFKTIHLLEIKIFPDSGVSQECIDGMYEKIMNISLRKSYNGFIVDDRVLGSEELVAHMRHSSRYSSDGHLHKIKNW